MTVATQKRMSLEEYLNYDDGTDIRYELEDGVLVAMGAESTLNNWIAGFLYAHFLQQMGLPFYRLGMKQHLQVDSVYATVRDPDLIVHSEESALAIEGRAEVCLRLGEPNPWLVIEVVSPGNEDSDNYQRDYGRKPQEYASRGIPEMWQIDPSLAWVRVGSLTNEGYVFVTFQGDAAIASPTFPNLKLTAEVLLRAGR